jgi:hypothetical protein
MTDDDDDIERTIRAWQSRGLSYEEMWEALKLPRIYAPDRMTVRAAMRAIGRGAYDARLKHGPLPPVRKAA